MDDVRFVLWTFLVIGVPSIALPLPLAFLMQSFGRHRWAARRALVTSVVLGTVGYIISLSYYAYAGIPHAIQSNPESSQSMFNLAILGAFLGSGYGSLGAFFYFYWHRDNPARGWW